MSKADLVTGSYTAPRLFAVTVRTPLTRTPAGRFQPRSHRLFVKVPYSATFAMSEALSRAMTTGQVEGFSVKVVPPRQIAAIRPLLLRWNEALDTIREVDWNL